MAITERQISTRAYSDSDEPSIRLASEEQYYGKFSEFSKADIQIIMLGERIVGKKISIGRMRLVDELSRITACRSLCLRFRLW